MLDATFIFKKRKYTVKSGSRCIQATYGEIVGVGCRGARVAKA